MKNKSIIIDLFYGNMVRQTICKACKNPINALFSIFNILELSIYKNRKENEISLESLFKSYFTEQDDEYPMFCKTCGKEEEDVENKNKTKAKKTDEKEEEDVENKKKTKAKKTDEK